MIIDNYYAAIMLLANVLLLAIACWAILRFERRCRQIEAFWASPTGSAVADSADDLVTAQLRMTQQLDQRVGELQRTVKVMELKQNEKADKPVERSLPIENAMRMAKQGASIEDLTRSCGLNIGEAQLMQKLHGRAAVQIATGS